jgi:hypothetical protein
MFYYDYDKSNIPPTEIIEKVNLLIKNMQYFDNKYLNFLYHYVYKNKDLKYLGLNVFILNELYTNGFFKDKNVYNSPDEFRILDTSLSSSDIYRNSIIDYQPILQSMYTTSSKLMRCELKSDIIEIPNVKYDINKIDEFRLNLEEYFNPIVKENLYDIVYEIVIFIMKKFKYSKSLYLNEIVSNIQPYFNNKILLFYRILSDDIETLNKYENYIGRYVEHKKFGYGFVTNQKSTHYDLIRATDKDDCTIDIEFNDGTNRRFIMSLLNENNLLKVIKKENEDLVEPFNFYE